ncbi:MAG: hypothetical protein IPG79_16985 [Saprospiraceae bacterium]|nr:hypothetical protein [Saprospiraceae bacterium]
MKDLCKADNFYNKDVKLLEKWNCCHKCNRDPNQVISAKMPTNEEV